MDKEIEKFLSWLTKGDVVLAYWNPEKNELMPIDYKEGDLSSNYSKNNHPISGKVKRL